MKRVFPAKNGWQDALQKLREENAELKKVNQLLLGGLVSDDKRVVAAAEKAGIVYMGCDTPDLLADTILELRKGD